MLNISEAATVSAQLLLVIVILLLLIVIIQGKIWKDLIHWHFSSHTSTQYHLLIICAWVSFNLIEAVRGCWLTENPYKWWSSGCSLTNKEMLGAGFRQQYLKLLVLKLVQVGFTESNWWGYSSFINMPSHYGVKSVILCWWASLRAELLCSLVWGYWTSPPKGQFLGAQRNQE